MASERMRILICKFELSNVVISSRCLAATVCPEVPQIAARAIPGAHYGCPAPSVHLASLSGSECLAFLIPTQNTQNCFETILNMKPTRFFFPPHSGLDWVAWGAQGRQKPDRLSPPLLVGLGGLGSSGKPRGGRKPTGFHPPLGAPTSVKGCLSASRF